MRSGIITRVSLMLLFLMAALFVFLSVKTYRNNYFNYNLLRLDPLDEDRSGEQLANLNTSEIWMLGDSRIARWDKDLLKEESEIANLGIEGQTSAQVYYRLKNYLIADTPSLLILQVGINDLKVIGLDKNLETEIVSNLYRNIKAICSLCIENNIRVILLNIFPIGKIEPARRLVWNKNVEKALLTINEDLKSLSDNKHIFYFDAYSILSDGGMRVRREFQDDFLHINTSGYNLLSSRMKEQIRNVFNSKE